jgi:tetratricopeptide (TPR) repeat protein
MARSGESNNLASDRISVDAALLQARDHLQAGRLDEAEHLVRLILRVQPKHADANHVLGKLLLSRNKPQHALPFLLSAVNANSSDGQFWFAYIDALILAKQPHAAHRALQIVQQAGVAEAHLQDFKLALKDLQEREAKDFNYFCNVHGSDKGDIFPEGNNYAKWYDHWFAPLREAAKEICEIGLYNGGSIKAMCEYFPHARILGLDIDDKSAFNTDRVDTRKLDQGNFDDLNGFVLECQSKARQFDIIIDDGSHDVEHQQMTFGRLFQLLQPGGLYIIEDMGSSYFKLGTVLYSYKQTQTKINNNTIQFLNQRPFSSPWINTNDIDYINQEVESVSIFDICNHALPYQNRDACINGYPLRSISAVIRKLA